MATDRKSPRSSRIRTLVLIGVGLLFVLFLSASGVARLYTDWLWFDALGLSSVWSTVLGTQIVLAVVFSLIFFVLLWTNMYLADRLAPRVRPESPEEDLIERYHQLVGSHANKIRLGVAAIFGLVAGGNTAAQWRTWLLFREGGDFGRVDPLFNRDAGFYVFRLPFWTFLVDWFFSALVFALIVSLIAHYLNGGIRASATATNRTSSGVKLHLSVLLAVLALLRAVAYWLDRFHLVNSTRGLYDGALTTDVEVQLPALNLLAMVSVFGALLFILNIRRQGWALPVVAMGLWAVSHVVVATIFPALFQRLRVEPEQSQREQEYIGFNIDATRFAYGLDDEHLVTIDFGYEPQLTAEQLTNNADVFEDVAILDPTLATDAFNRSESGRESYQFSDPLDVDRYLIDGELEPVTLAVRSLNLRALAEGWEREHVVLTHGYGVAMAAGNRADRGLPEYLVQGIGPSARTDEGLDAALDRPQVYYDEGFGGYAIVGATRDEVDFVAETTSNFRYDGTGGVVISGLVRRAAFALRFQELNPLISPFIQDGSRVIYNRDIEGRIRELAPFLSYDSDPYPVIADGRIQWIIDAYTTTSDFPYAQKVDVASLPPSADLSSGFNYVRNSVKVVVDGYDGDVSFYVIDDEDPIIEAYVDIFPDLFQPEEEAPADIRSHFRYPSDLFTVQTETWDTYQVSDPIRFLEGALAWRVASQPQRSAGNDETNTTAALMQPQYRTTRLPNEDETEMVLQRALVPSSSDASTGRPEVKAIMVGRAGAENRGQLIQYRMTTGALSAPDLVDSDIRRDDTISPFISLRNQEGSIVQFGEMQMIIVENTVVYVRPLYIEAQTGTAVPELTQVIAVAGGRIAMAPTLASALAQVAADGSGTPAPESDPAPDSDEDPSEEPTVEVPTPEQLAGLSVAELLDVVQVLLDDANRIEESDPALAAELRQEASDALEQLGKTLGVPPARSEPAGA